MTYCLNPTCWNPHNLDDARFCQNCGARLLLGDRYRPLQVLGQGGFGRTFLAIDERAKDPNPSHCVIKQTLPNSRESSDRITQLFRQEAERLAELGQHPQIPRLLNHYKLPEGQYLVQEFIDGENLEQILVKEGPFNATQIRQLLESLLPVLEFIHSRRVIHRDIKPENIIRRRDIPQKTGATLREQPAPSALNLALVDFGASKYASPDPSTRTGTVIGSAAYAAPEQTMGKPTFASDLYSLGVTCIHLLTGLHPFDLYSVGKDDWVWQQYLPEPIDLPLQRVLEKMLQRATSQRYRTATEVLADLKLQTTPVLALRIPAEASVSRAGLRSRPNLPTPSPSSSNLVPPPGTWEGTGTLLGHAGSVTTLVLHPNGHLLASGSADRTLKLWDLATGELKHTFGGRSLRFSGGHSGRITALACSPDGDLLISGSEDGSIKFWDLLGYQLVTTLPIQGWGVGAIATSSGSPIFASGDVDGRIDLWDLETGEPIASLGKHRGQVSALLLSPDGQTLISSSFDKTIRLWDVRGNRLISTLRGHNAAVTAIAITPDWRTLISASQDRELRFWDLNRRERGRTLLAHENAVNCLAIAPHGRLLATGSEDNRIKLWQLQPNDQGATTLGNSRPQFLYHTWAINALTFTPDGQTLISGSVDETIRIWKMIDS